MPTDNTPNAPLYEVLGEIAALWALAIVGHYALLPLFGFELSYNTSPIAIAVYFLLWCAAGAAYFRRTISRQTRVKLWPFTYAALSLALAGVVWGLLYLFSLLPATQGPRLSLYTDLLLATQWYFLPKAAEILLQQLLITVLVLELYARLRTVKKVAIAYAVSFGAMHAFLFSFTGAPAVYAAIMTAGALLSAFVFPYMILRVRGGFVYAYGIQLIFYIFLAMLFRAWPPPGYGL